MNGRTIELFVKYAACILYARVYINFREIFMKISNLIFEFFRALESILLVKFRKSDCQFSFCIVITYLAIELKLAGVFVEL